MSLDPAHKNDAQLISQNEPLCRKLTGMVREMQDLVAAETGVRAGYAKITLQMHDDSVLELRAIGPWDAPTLAQAVTPP